MTAAKEKSDLATISRWAVGRYKNSLLVALQLNNDVPVLMKIGDARQLAAALESEAHALAQLQASSRKA
jgi:hypothetical protein